MRQEIKTYLVTCDDCGEQHVMTGVSYISKFIPEFWKEVLRCGYGMTDYCKTVLLCGACAANEESAHVD